MKENPGKLLWILLGLFCLRVAGQLLVFFFNFSWLPPMDLWYSGLITYPILFLIQVVMIVVMAKICLDVSLTRGFFNGPFPRAGAFLVGFSYVYFASMILRLVIFRRGIIPIVFHCVLAVFLYLYGRYQRRAVS